MEPQYFDKGTSDPYVKFKMGGRLLFRSRTVHRDLNPVWDEIFLVPVEDPFQPITIKVFDYDWGLQDDFMGSAKLSLTTLDLGTMQDLIVKLEDPARPNRNLGELKISITLWPRTQEDKEQVGVSFVPISSACTNRLPSFVWFYFSTFRVTSVPQRHRSVLSRRYGVLLLPLCLSKGKTCRLTRRIA